MVVVFICRNRGPLLQDLVSVLLRVDPSDRPSAKQILHIPAMQPYVNKVLTRGRTQRSESVSYGDEQCARKANVWRKPDVIPAFENKIKDSFRNECNIPLPNHVEDESSKSVNCHPGLVWGHLLPVKTCFVKSSNVFQMFRLFTVFSL